MFHEMTLKLYFMKSTERNISQCILSLMSFTEISKGILYQSLLNLKHKRRLFFLQIKLISLIDLSPLVMQ